MVMNELQVILEQSECEAIAYANDIVLVISGRFVGTIRDKLQLALRSACVWASVRRLGVNPVKTEVVLFTGRYKTFRPLKLNGTERKGTGTQTGSMLSRTHSVLEVILEIEYH